MVIDNFIISLKQAIGFNIMEGFMRFVFQGELSLWILMLSTASLSISYIMYTFMSSNSFFSSFNSFLFLLMQNWSSFICPIWSHDRMIHYYGLSINEIDVFHPIDLVENPLRCIRQQIFWIERDVWKVLAVLVLSIDVTIYIPKIYQFWCHSTRLYRNRHRSSRHLVQWLESIPFVIFWVKNKTLSSCHFAIQKDFINKDIGADGIWHVKQESTPLVPFQWKIRLHHVRDEFLQTLGGIEDTRVPRGKLF